MKFCSIASGSSGNCYYLEIEEQKYLVDAGISFKRIREGLAGINVDIADIAGLFVTHEHTDHVSALPMILKKTQIPIFSSTGTLRALQGKFEGLSTTRLHDLSVVNPLVSGDTMVTSFNVYHDAANPIGFVFESRQANKKVGIVTDTGKIDPEITEKIHGVNLLVVEANYDEHTLKNGDYPAFLKRRILSSDGHLSNLAAAKILHDICHERLSHVFLGHLSKENNLPFIAKDAVCQFLEDFSKEITFELDCLSRNMPGELIVVK